MSQNKTKGYLAVATIDSFFYKSALNLFETIKDFDPEAKVCLATEKSFLDGREKEICDYVIDAPNHVRGKMQAMANTPFDQTFYIDADTDCEHEDILTVFDLFEDNDIVWTALDEKRRYCFVEVLFPAGELYLCGGVCLYDTTKPLVREFMQDWYDLYVKQNSGAWWPTNEKGEFDFENYPQSLKRWDQFTLWWLVNKEPKYASLKHGVFENDARWNYYSKYHDHLDHNNGQPIVIRHYSDGNVKTSV